MKSVCFLLKKIVFIIWFLVCSYIFYYYYSHNNQFLTGNAKNELEIGAAFLIMLANFPISYVVMSFIGWISFIISDLYNIDIFDFINIYMIIVFNMLLGYFQYFKLVPYIYKQITKNKRVKQE